MGDDQFLEYLEDPTTNEHKNILDEQETDTPI